MGPSLRTALLVATIGVAGLTGCGGSSEGPSPVPSASATPSSGSPTTSPTGSGTEPSAAGGRIALLMPGPPSMRSEAFDRSTFADAVHAHCPACRVDFYDARGRAALQTEQLQDAVDRGAQVLVLDAVEPFSVVNSVVAAQERGVKVVGYDTLLEGLDFYVSYDRDQVGRLQAEALLDAIDGTGSLVMVNGSPTDAGAVQVKNAAHQVIAGSKATVAGEYDIDPDRPRATRTWLSTIFTFFPPATLAGVYAADDAIAGEVVRALPGDSRLPVTGAGATLAGVKRLVSGRQLMTVYRPVGPAADTTARIAVAAIGGGDPGQPTITLDDVPTYLLDPVAVDADNLADTVVADDFWTVGDICSRPLRADCRRLGLL